MVSNENLQQELIKDLLIESAEGLDRYDRELLSLEEGQGGPETMNNIFRVIHTLKGTAGCLGLHGIERTAHAGEDLLSMLRSGKLQPSPSMISALLSLSDALRSMLRELEAHGNEGSNDYSALMQLLGDLQSANPDTAAPSVPASAAPAFGLFEDEIGQEGPAATPPADPKDAAYGLFGDDAQDTVPNAPDPVPAPTTLATAAGPAPSSVPSDSFGKGSAADNAIRVDIAQLDKVMNLVGELVLARNQIVANTTQFDQAALMTASQRLNIITTELQESVMKTRMQPIGNIWAKFPRVVRDVSKDLNKRVRLILEGQSTELDRTIIEAIKDPLTHIIRNSIDHGIEHPDARRQAGKAEEGLLSLRAYHEGGQVNIEIMDDGGGINVERVKSKAVAQGLLTPENAARLSEREALNLIFLPGLSTAEKITNVSGRGVGMDVVRTNIEKIGGSIDIQSQTGQGTTIKIKIPLTLAIIPALIVTSGGERFAIPQVSLLELVRLEGQQARSGIEQLYESPVYRLRGQLLPLTFLNREFKLHERTRQAEADPADEVLNIIVLQADGRPFGLVVDEINDTEEIVVKPLSKQLKGLACFAGATIMGDGRVALILDVVGLAQHSNVVDENRSRRQTEDKHKTADDAGLRQTLLLFTVGNNQRMAIPLARAARLEEFPASRIERSGSGEVIQYRGQILPLIRVAQYVVCGDAGCDATEVVKVVVCAEAGTNYGLVVNEIHDIVDEAVAVKRTSAGRGILGSAVIQSRVTDLLDVSGIIRASDPTQSRSAA